MRWEASPDPIAVETAGAVRIARIEQGGTYPTGKTKLHFLVGVTIAVPGQGLSLSIMPLLRFGTKICSRRLIRCDFRSPLSQPTLAIIGDFTLVAYSSTR